MIEGKSYRFVVSGLYDGLFVMEDTQTRTLWSHMTGEGLSGEHAGYQMPVSNLLHMSVAQALAMDSAMKIAISERPFNSRRGRRMRASRFSADRPGEQLRPMFVQTLGEEDTRVERMDMGLGVWNDNTQKYYSVKVLREKGNYLLDEMAGQKLLVFLDPLTSTPTALYWYTETVSIEGRKINLSDGYSIQTGQIFDSEGELVKVEKPQQMFTRWYGFSLSFPDPEIIE